ncbi:hypothetical protein Salat_1587000 [Sesamum alatum]|uniref:Uncharacterized protein n=1 Tax=Sesamum alatum TaxID=300844 RepID=A0AAE2CN22_9LAMI|nr:hypothetical protein Salat_1587000 [Sesamum alatum]
MGFTIDGPRKRHALRNLGDSLKLGDTDCSPILQAANGECKGDEWILQARDTFWSAPQPEILSPHTASPLKLLKSRSYSAIYVPETSSAAGSVTQTASGETSFY